ncbi:MAG TPA: S41 family peptidase, partial [Bryobacteraceae bacterium]|nr:S41 family peptidase [Bryobacteraceae bacterium]
DFMIRPVLFALLLAVPLAAASAPETEQASAMKRLADVLSIVQDNAMDPVDLDQAFYGGAIPGLLRNLDPHSSFFDPDQFEQLSQMQRSTSKGFGTVVSVLPGRVLVLQTLPDTPAARAGIIPGDEIHGVNNYPLDRLEPEQIIELLKESRQKPVALAVRHPGALRLVELRLVPQEMQSPSVDRVFELQPGVGYIRVNAFEGSTGRDIRAAIEKLGGQKLKGLVLDLRDNPGGLVASAIETARLFLKPGQVILSVKGRNVPESTERVPADNVPYTFPVSVLVNGKTASAAEIVTAALQDHDRATVLGEPTFGKGLVQSVYPLEEKSGLALTTALYYTASGRSIQKPFRQEGFELGATAAHPNEQKDFKTDNGRPIPGGGGIVPDIAVDEPVLTPFQAALEASGSFTRFALEYVRDHKVEAGWKVPPAMLDQFQLWLGDRQIQPALSEWLAQHDFIVSRLKEEVYTVALGSEAGDQVGAQRDPEVKQAVACALNPPTFLAKR